MRTTGHDIRPSDGAPPASTAQLCCRKYNMTVLSATYIITDNRCGFYATTIVCGDHRCNKWTYSTEYITINYIFCVNQQSITTRHSVIIILWRVNIHRDRDSTKLDDSSSELRNVQNSSRVFKLSHLASVYIRQAYKQYVVMNTHDTYFKKCSV